MPPLALSLLGMTSQILRELLTKHTHLRNCGAEHIVCCDRHEVRAAVLLKIFVLFGMESVAWQTSEGKNCYRVSFCLHIPGQITLNIEVAGCREALMTNPPVPMAARSKG